MAPGGCLFATDDGRALHLVLDGTPFAFTEPCPTRRGHAGLDPLHARAPVAGLIAQVAVVPGAAVVAGQRSSASRR